MTKQTIVIPKANPILGNSPPEKEWRNAHGTFKVGWIEQIDAHGLFFSDGVDTLLLATHNNGHSCAALAERVCKGDLAGAERQRRYITECGGTAISTEKIIITSTGHVI